MERLTAPTKSLHPNDWNPNKMNERQYAAELESIKTYGFIDPITVRAHPSKKRQYEILDGEHRWRAAQELGIDTLPLVVVDVDDVNARKLTIVLNETRGKADIVDLGALLAELASTIGADDLRLGLPYSELELEELIGVGEFDWDEHLKASPEDDEDAFIRFTVAMPRDAHEVLSTARERLAQRLKDDGRAFHKDAAVAAGQAIEMLAAEYLAGP